MALGLQPGRWAGRTPFDMSRRRWSVERRKRAASCRRGEVVRGSAAPWPEHVAVRFDLLCVDCCSAMERPGAVLEPALAAHFGRVSTPALCGRDHLPAFPTWMSGVAPSEQEAELCTLLQFAASAEHFAAPRAPAEALRDPQLRRSLETARAALHQPAQFPAPPRPACGSGSHPCAPRADPGTPPARAQAPRAAPGSPPPPSAAPAPSASAPARTARSRALTAIFAPASSSTAMEEPLGSQIATSAVPGGAFARGAERRMAAGVCQRCLPPGCLSTNTSAAGSSNGSCAAQLMRGAPAHSYHGRHCAAPCLL